MALSASPGRTTAERTATGSPTAHTRARRLPSWRRTAPMVATSSTGRVTRAATVSILAAGPLNHEADLRGSVLDESRWTRPRIAHLAPSEKAEATTPKADLTTAWVAEQTPMSQRIEAGTAIKTALPSA